MNALLAILNVFVDPAETVRRIKGVTFAWFPPILIGGLIMGFYQYMIVPYTLQALRANPPQGMDPAKFSDIEGTVQTMSRFMAFTAPVMYAIIVLIGAALIFAACAVLSINVKFPNIFNLLAHVSLINSLALVAHYFVLKGKGEVNSTKELAPSFGLEMFLPESAPNLLYGFLSYFSVFNLWHIAVLVVGFAALAEISKGRAFVATAPHWIAGLLFTLVGALFR